MNIVWGTASTGGYGGTVFPGGIRYSLVNNVCGVQYSLGYRIHSDTVMISFFVVAAENLRPWLYLAVFYRCGSAVGDYAGLRAEMVWKGGS